MLRHKVISFFASLNSPCLFAIIGACLCLTSVAVAAPGPRTCEADPETRQLDYWVGNWSMTNSGPSSGTAISKVSLSLDKCAFVEHWNSGKGHVTEKTFAYSPDDKNWYGMFVDNEGRAHVFTQGKVASGTAEFDGPSRGPNGEAVLNRLKVVQMGANKIEESWEKSTDNAATWKLVYRADYTRKSVVSLARTSGVSIMRANIAKVILFVLIVVSTMLAEKNSAPTVMLTSGSTAGLRFGADQHGAEFRGIPYAAPPIGELRWKPPRPVSKWNGTRQATQFGAACAQLPASWFQNVASSEDCLFLNVWTPQLSKNAKLPVLVYFHGGGNTLGYSQMTPVGVLANLGVVVVSANYRLGPFGFLARPTLTAESPHHSSGNYGLLDQLQALRWVRENIAQFGGDPNRVTVMGQSAGAVDVCLLMASPLAAGLFQGAIMESGECQSTYNEDIRTPIPFNGISGTGESIGEILAADLGGSKDAAGLQKLRSLTPEQILKAWKQDSRVHFDAIVDGWVVPEQPAKIFAEGRQMRIPVIVGSNADEATVFGHEGPQTVDAYKKYLSEDTGKYSAEEFRAYPANTDSEVRAAYFKLQSDTFAYGAYSLAQAMMRAGQKAYVYYFTFAEKGQRAELGAYHGLELRVLCVGLAPDSGPDEKLGEAMRAYWVQFARSGNPNGSSAPNWPALNSRELRLELGRKIQVEPVGAGVKELEGIMRQLLQENTATASAGK